MTNEANMTTSLANAINDHCRQFEASDEYHDMIRTHVRKLYEKTIEDTFRWGKFPDAVKKALGEALPANITEMVDMPRYNILLARTLAEQWQANAVGEKLATQMQGLVKEFIEQDQTPKFITASALWQAYIEQYLDDAAHEGWERPEVVVEEKEESWGKFFYIGLNKEPYQNLSWSSNKPAENYFQCEIYLGFRLENESHDRDAKPLLHEGNEVYSLFTGKLEHSDTLGKRVISFRTKFEKLVGALYYGDSLLVLDESDADEIYYPAPY